MPDIFQQLCCRRDQIWDGMRQLFHFIILIGFDLFHLLFYFLRFFTVRCRFDADTFRFGQMYIVQVFEIAVIASVIPDTFQLSAFFLFSTRRTYHCHRTSSHYQPDTTYYLFHHFSFSGNKSNQDSLISKYL